MIQNTLCNIDSTKLNADTVIFNPDTMQKFFYKI